MSFMRKFAAFVRPGSALNSASRCAPRRAAGRPGFPTPGAGEESGPEEGAAPGQVLDETLDPRLDEALADFRLSIHAQSAAAYQSRSAATFQSQIAATLQSEIAAAYQRPRTAPAAAPWRRRSARLAVGWALGCVLVAGGASAGVWEHHQQQQRVAAARLAEHERLVAAEQAEQKRKAEEDLLAKVDSDVSQEVPTAMEPLAQLMSGEAMQ